MTAHYFASKARKILIISMDCSPVGTTYTVAGKADARKLALSLGAKPWNF